MKLRMPRACGLQAWRRKPRLRASDALVDLGAGGLRQPERDDRQARDVVGAVARGAVRARRRRRAGRCPTSSTIVSRCESRARGSVAGGVARAALGGPSAIASRSTAAVWPADLRPGELGADAPRLGAGALEPLRVVEQADDRRGERGGIVERRRARRRRRRAGPRRSSTASRPSRSPRRSRTSARPTRSARATGTASGRSWCRRASSRGRRARGSGRRTRRARRGRGRAPGARARSGTPRRGAWPPRGGSARRSRRAPSGWRATIAGIAAIATSMPLPGEISPKVASTWRSVRGPVACGRGSSSDGPPWGTTRTRSGGARRAATIIRRAVSVNTHTSVARPQSARSVSAWRTDGADRTVCSVRTIGCRSPSASDRMCAPSSPPKIPYSCWMTTTSSPRRSSTRAAAA